MLFRFTPTITLSTGNGDIFLAKYNSQMELSMGKKNWFGINTTSIY